MPENKQLTRKGFLKGRSYTYADIIRKMVELLNAQLA